MQHNIKLAIIGGTGKSGKYLVQEVLAQGYSCKLLLRNPKKLIFKSPLIEVVQGDARSEQDIHALIQGCGAIISTLGQPKREAPIFREATQHILQAMKAFGVKRYITTAGLNVDAPDDQKGEKTQMATAWMKANYPQITEDRQSEFQLLSASDVDWTLVRLPLIEQTEESRPVRVQFDDCPGEKIRITDLAHFLIDQLSDDKYSRKAPFIANG